MRPIDHPEFFRMAPPEGRSRESTIRLDREGRFWHDGALVEHPKLAAAMHTWIGRHPDDGRFILTNGYDWTYFTVEHVPYFVRSVRLDSDADGGAVWLRLSDETEERWDPALTTVADDGSLRTRVKAGTAGGPFDAQFTRHAQASLAPVLVEDGQDGAIAAKVGGEICRLAHT